MKDTLAWIATAVVGSALWYLITLALLTLIKPERIFPQ